MQVLAPSEEYFPAEHAEQDMDRPEIRLVFFPASQFLQDDDRWFASNRPDGQNVQLTVPSVAA